MLYIMKRFIVLVSASLLSLSKLEELHDISDDIKFCANVTCQNGGMCTKTLEGLACLCKRDYSGEFCQNIRQIEHQMYVGTMRLRADPSPLEYDDHRFKPHLVAEIYRLYSSILHIDQLSVSIVEMRKDERYLTLEFEINITIYEDSLMKPDYTSVQKTFLKAAVDGRLGLFDIAPDGLVLKLAHADDTPFNGLSDEVIATIVLSSLLSVLSIPVVFVIIRIRRKKHRQKRSSRGIELPTDMDPRHSLDSFLEFDVECRSYQPYPQSFHYNNTGSELSVSNTVENDDYENIDNFHENCLANENSKTVRQYPITNSYPQNTQMRVRVDVVNSADGGESSDGYMTAEVGDYTTTTDSEYHTDLVQSSFWNDTQYHWTKNLKSYSDVLQKKNATRGTNLSKKQGEEYKMFRKTTISKNKKKNRQSNEVYFDACHDQELYFMPTEDYHKPSRQKKRGEGRYLSSDKNRESGYEYWIKRRSKRKKTLFKPNLNLHRRMSLPRFFRNQIARLTKDENYGEWKHYQSPKSTGTYSDHVVQHRRKSQKQRKGHEITDPSEPLGKLQRSSVVWCRPTVRKEDSSFSNIHEINPGLYQDQKIPVDDFV